MFENFTRAGQTSVDERIKANPPTATQPNPQTPPRLSHNNSDSVGPHRAAVGDVITRGGGGGGGGGGGTRYQVGRQSPPSCKQRELGRPN